MSLRSLPILAALACAALLAAACSDEVPPPATPTPSASASPSPTAASTPQANAPAFLQDLEVVLLRFGDPMDLPADLAVIVEMGCTGCGGPASGLRRVYTDPSGAIREEILVDSSKLGYPQRTETFNGITQSFDPPITSYWAAPDASYIAVSVCLQGTCGMGGGLSQWSAESRAAFAASTDGGVTWEHLGQIPVGAVVDGRMADGSLLISTFDEPGAFGNTRLFPSMSPVHRPNPAARVVAVDGEEIYWGTDTGDVLVTTPASGWRLLATEAPAGEAWVEAVIVAPGSPSRLASVGMTDPQHRGATHYLLPIDGADNLGSGMFAFDPGVAYTFPGGRTGPWVARFRFLFGYTFDGPAPLRPLAINLDTQTIHAMDHPFADGTLPGGINHVAAVTIGPFARVVNTGSCLNIRESPAAAGRILECVADRVLLTIPERASSLPAGVYAEGWLEVVSPSGTRGWAMAEYLEY